MDKDKLNKLKQKFKKDASAHKWELNGKGMGKGNQKFNFISQEDMNNWIVNWCSTNNCYFQQETTFNTYSCWTEEVWVSSLEGETIASGLHPLMPSTIQNDQAQNWGSGSTYAIRYATMKMLGLAKGMDPDTHNKQKETKPKNDFQKSLKSLQDKCKKSGKVWEEYLEKLGVSHPTTNAEYQKLIDAINNRGGK